MRLYREDDGQGQVRFFAEPGGTRHCVEVDATFPESWDGGEASPQLAAAFSTALCAHARTASKISESGADVYARSCALQGGISPRAPVPLFKGKGGGMLFSRAIGYGAMKDACLADFAWSSALRRETRRILEPSGYCLTALGGTGVVLVPIAALEGAADFSGEDGVRQGCAPAIVSIRRSEKTVDGWLLGKDGRFEPLALPLGQCRLYGSWIFSRCRGHAVKPPRQGGFLVFTARPPESLVLKKNGYLSAAAAWSGGLREVHEKAVSRARKKAAERLAGFYEGLLAVVAFSPDNACRWITEAISPGRPAPYLFPLLLDGRYMGITLPESVSGSIEAKWPRQAILDGRRLPRHILPHLGWNGGKTGIAWSEKAEFPKRKEAVRPIKDREGKTWMPLASGSCANDQLSGVMEVYSANAPLLGPAPGGKDSCPETRQPVGLAGLFKRSPKGEDGQGVVFLEPGRWPLHEAGRKEGGRAGIVEVDSAAVPVERASVWGTKPCSEWTLAPEGMEMDAPGWFYTVMYGNVLEVDPRDRANGRLLAEHWPFSAYIARVERERQALEGKRPAEEGPGLDR